MRVAFTCDFAGGRRQRRPRRKLKGVVWFEFLSRTVRPYFWIFLGAPWRWRTACRLGPPVLWRRRTFDRRIERCAPAVPQHDRARTSAIPLPAHRPCAAASQQSPAAIVPHGDVGCLVGFRQEGSAPSTQYMRCLIKGGNSFACFIQKVHNLCQPCLLYTSPSPRDRG